MVNKLTSIYLSFIYISVCVPGMYDSSGTCTNCSTASRKTVPGDDQNLCLDCPNDSTTDGSGKSLDTDCGRCVWVGGGRVQSSSSKRRTDMVAPHCIKTQPRIVSCGCAFINIYEITSGICFTNIINTSYDILSVVNYYYLSVIFNPAVCVLGLEQSGSGATLMCSPCSKGTFREDHYTPICTMCPLANQTTVSMGSNSSDMCGESNCMKVSYVSTKIPGVT